MHIGRDGSEQPPCDIIFLLDFAHKTIGYGERDFSSARSYLSQELSPLASENSDEFVFGVRAGAMGEDSR